MASFSIPDLPLNPLGAHIPLIQDGSQSEGFWEKQDSLWPRVIPFDPQRAFLCVCSISLVPKKTESRDALILYSIRLLPVFVLAMTIALTIAMIITLRCLQETNTGYYPVSAVSSISEGKREADCKCLNLSPSIFCLRKC